VTDATPVPNSAVWAGKLAALYTIVLALLAVAMLTGIAVQTFKGYHHYEIGLYLKGIFLQTGVTMLMIATLAFVVQIVTNNKYAGFLLMLVYFISLPVLPALHFEHDLYRFANSPPAPYSDMNGYGPFVQPLVWFGVYWAIFCGLLLLAGHLLWVRGSERSLRHRLRIGGQRFGRGALATLAVLALAFVSCGSYIFYNTNVLNHYRTQDQIEKRSAEYEKLYKRYQRIPMPKITDVQADVDLFPARRAMEARGVYTLRNKTNAPISVLHVTVDPDVTRTTVTIPGATVTMSDPARGYTIYKLDPPLQPGATIPLRFNVSQVSRGFVNGTANTNIVANGTFFNNFAYFPNLGYQGGSELQDRNKRRKYGLPPVQRLAKIDDPWARNINEITGESDWLNLDTTVSTSSDQIAIAPGYLQKEWTANGRRYFRYKTTAPILGFWSYLSARYAVKRDRWHDVAIEVYYDPDHPYNVGRMIEGVKRALDYDSANFSPYQHKQVRILEFPRYAGFAQSFPNTIPYSESLGFIADLRNPDAIDYVLYVTAHEVGHQWWAHQVIGAQLQGDTMITETLAQYSALMVMQREYGRDMMQKFLRFELNAYLQGRGGELVAEEPLMLVENQPYVHYRKGSLAMYALADAIGEDKVDAALRKTIAQWAFHGPPYIRTTELLQNFREVTPPDRQSMIHDLFETITLYDNRTTEASAARLPDGRYRVRFTVQAKKVRADGMGNETQVPLDDWMDIGVLAPGPRKESVDRVLALEKVHITKPTDTFELIVKEKPSKAGIDPLNKLIDRNPEDNTKKM
ncbi:MAG TPA: M1 family aminopeptidase, partial [Thermoanaerobaculia bacterium]|nr:M1 family aminopeptidase [Thermoanaerobaculia bacterium]